MKKLEKWFEFKIRNFVKMSFVSTFVILTPFILFFSYFYNIILNQNFAHKINKHLVVGIQTGDLVNLKKAIFEIENNSFVTFYSLKNNDNEIIFEKLKESPVFYSNQKINIYNSSREIVGFFEIKQKLNFWIILYLFFVLMLIFIIIYFYNLRFIKNMNMEIVRNFGSLPSQVLNNSPRGLFVDIEEFNEIFSSLRSNVLLNLENEKYKSELIFNEKLVKMSKQLSHDIRSPLSTLNLISELINNEELKDLQIQVIQKINNIAEDLLKQSRNSDLISIENERVESEECKLFELFSLLKREQELKSKLIQFEFDNNLNDINISKNNSHKLYSIINNLINNAFDASAGTHKPVYCSFKSLNSQNDLFKFSISVVDFGVGIPPSVLEKLGKVQISFGKEKMTKSGNGIGIYNANQEILEMNGQLKIYSEVGQGSKFEILLP